MSRHGRLTTLKRRATAVAEDWFDRALPDAERWTRANLVRCQCDIDHSWTYAKWTVRSSAHFQLGYEPRYVQ
ncbi:MAG: hypothetical protein QGI74_09005 [Phycisphaerales bacterium]|nr:hypothetical protein [Phycisphaerales bacterium]